MATKKEEIKNNIRNMLDEIKTADSFRSAELANELKKECTKLRPPVKEEHKKLHDLLEELKTADPHRSAILAKEVREEVTKLRKQGKLCIKIPTAALSSVPQKTQGR